MWGQGDEEKTLLSSSGGSLDYGGASVSGEEEMDCGFIGGKNNILWRWVCTSLEKRGYQSRLQDQWLNNTFSKLSTSNLHPILICVFNSKLFFFFPLTTTLLRQLSSDAIYLEMHKIPQVKGPFQTPITSQGCYLCF